MIRKIISKQDIATEIANALHALARDIEHDKDSAIKIAATKLSVMLRSDEVFPLLKLISVDRTHCTMCGVCVPVTRASGTWCLGCSAKMRMIEESECAL